MDQATSEILKFTIALGTIPLVFGLRTLSVHSQAHGREHRNTDRASRWLVFVVLVVLSASALFTYYRGEWSRLADRVDGYDVFHYYLNAKYFDELEYDRLYVCALAADAEGNPSFAADNAFARVRSVRRLTDYQIVSRREALAATEACKARFEPERWASFVKDVAAVSRFVEPWEQGRMFADRGYNATPPWTFVGTAATHLGTLPRIAWIDFLLVLGMLVAVGWAYNPTSALVMTVFVFTMWSTRWPMIGSAMLRYDWIASAVVGMCLVKKERYGAGGAMLAWSAMSRVFPLALVGVFGLKALREVDWSKGVPLRQRVPVRYVRFAIGFLVCVATFVSLSVATRGTAQYARFAENISVHTDVEHISFQRVGFPIALTYDGELGQPKAGGRWFEGKKDALRANKPYLYGLAALLAALLFFLARGMRDEEALAFGFVIFFVSTIASYYYFVFIAVLALIHLGRISELKHVVGLSLLLLLPHLAFTAEHRLGFRYSVNALFSVGLSVYTLYLVLSLAVPELQRMLRGRRPSAEPPAVPSVPEQVPPQPVVPAQEP